MGIFCCLLSKQRDNFFINNILLDGMPICAAIHVFVVKYRVT